MQGPPREGIHMIGIDGVYPLGHGFKCSDDLVDRGTERGDQMT